MLTATSLMSEQARGEHNEKVCAISDLEGSKEMTNIGFSLIDFYECK